jgi:hypothetical protein
MRIAKFLAAPLVAALFGIGAPANAGIVIQVDKSAQQMTVAVDGVQRYVWPVSTGRSGYATPAGSHQAFRMEEDHFSKEWDEAPMPHSIFFTRAGHAIHGSFDVKRLGSAASHGCVRLAPKNAATLFALVKQEGLPNTKVVIGGAEPSPAVAKRRVPREPGGETDGYTARARSYDDGVRVSTDSYDRREVDAYTARMRQRYSVERPAARYDERVPSGSYYDPRNSYTPYQGAGYPAGGYGYRY